MYHYFNYFRYDRCENVYFLFIAPNSFRPENTRFKGITNETITRGPSVCVV